MIKQYNYVCGLLLTLAGMQPVMAGEVLQSISDDTVSTSVESGAEQSDRRFNYRVICAPDDEALPDCNSQPATVETNGKPTMVLPVPDFPADAADIEGDEKQLVKPHSAQRDTPRKKAAKKQQQHGSKKASKKSAKKRTKK